MQHKKMNLIKNCLDINKWLNNRIQIPLSLIPQMHLTALIYDDI